ncbi:hypothetical protein LTR05_001882 [Lithohypha guttulata]|uniref:Uncharacterized protein n=1 Tax=Lithohypha guttulata TaxID=1690604 RepID=A0AAN7YFM9_9EURO|nr:hypothetical protein LTR05_001882 [Lithohypha guttulata]
MDQQHEPRVQRGNFKVFDASTSRPILQRLNADSSWLLSLPYPQHLQPPLGRCRFNVIIDAWLRGRQIDLFSWFSSQEHAEPSSVESINQLNALLQTAEREVTGQSFTGGEQTNFVDLVACSHEFTDHCHEATLRELPGSVLVLAPKKAASLVRSWKHFDNVVEISMYGTNSHHTLLPDWLSVERVHTKGDASIHFHSALIVTFSLTAGQRSEAIVYTPHGIKADSLISALALRPATELLALLHGLHDISLAGAQLNLGMENAIKIRQFRDVKYWFATHDEVKLAYGMVAWMLKRTEHTLQLAPGSHPITEHGSAPGVSEDTFVSLENGDCFILR